MRPDTEPEPPAPSEPPEHRRYAAYLAALEAVTGADAAAGPTGGPDEADLVAHVLRDEDPVMAQSAVIRHVDRRAAALLTAPGFVTWCTALTGAVAGRDFVLRRLGEWTLLRAITLGEGWTPEALATASDWCQRTAVSGRFPVSSSALSLLAEHGRTRRVRTAAARPAPAPPSAPAERG
ncbi:hypothetical protein ABZ135_13320 [Streptomyces sp. NPDC006339]|uniref:hypothetical protein n=1 Tax=Streptomyces sp. NPDC006339 TaxID=3156755 RepID=UPI0033B9B2AF